MENILNNYCFLLENTHIKPKNIKDIKNINNFIQNSQFSKVISKLNFIKKIKINNIQDKLFNSNKDLKKDYEIIYNKLGNNINTKFKLLLCSSYVTLNNLNRIGEGVITQILVKIYNLLDLICAGGITLITIKSILELMSNAIYQISFHSPILAKILTQGLTLTNKVSWEVLICITILFIILKYLCQFIIKLSRWMSKKPKENSTYNQDKEQEDLFKDY